MQRLLTLNHKPRFDRFDGCNDKPARTKVSVSAAPTVFSKSGPHQLLSICQSKKHPPRKRFASKDEAVEIFFLGS